jgi:thioredoxin 1
MGAYDAHHGFHLAARPAPGNVERMHSIPNTTDDRFTADVLESDVPVVVDFTASWCPPCRMMDPVIGELAAERDDLRFLALDVDAHQATAARYGVLSMPTFMVFRGGAPVATFIGARPKARMRQELSEVVPPVREQVLVQEAPAR